MVYPLRRQENLKHLKYTTAFPFLCFRHNKSNQTCRSSSLGLFLSCFQNHSYNIIMVFHLPLKWKHWRHCFRQHSADTALRFFWLGITYSYVVLSDAVVVMDSSLCLSSADAHRLSVALWLTPTPWHWVASQQTSIWLLVCCGGWGQTLAVIGVFYHIPDELPGSVSRVCTLSEQLHSRHTLSCNMHAWIATRKTQTRRKHKTHI